MLNFSPLRFKGFCKEVLHTFTLINFLWQLFNVISARILKRDKRNVHFFMLGNELMWLTLKRSEMP